MKRSLALILWLAAAPAPASADAIPPPDDIDCRPGERLVNDHGGTRCELPFCQSQADCPAGTRCPQRHCYAMVPSRFAGCPGAPEGSKEPPDPCDPVREVRGPCADAAPRCPDGESCGLGQCAWDGEPPPPVPRAPDVHHDEDDEREDDEDDGSEPTASSDTPPTEPRSGGGCFGSRGTRGAAAWPLLGLGVIGIAMGRRRR